MLDELLLFFFLLLRVRLATGVFKLLFNLTLDFIRRLFVICVGVRGDHLGVFALKWAFPPKWGIFKSFAQKGAF